MHPFGIALEVEDDLEGVHCICNRHDCCQRHALMPPGIEESLVHVQQQTRQSATRWNFHEDRHCVECWAHSFCQTRHRSAATSHSRSVKHSGIWLMLACQLQMPHQTPSGMHYTCSCGPALAGQHRKGAENAFNTQPLAADRCTRIQSQNPTSADHRPNPPLADNLPQMSDRSRCGIGVKHQRYFSPGKAFEGGPWWSQYICDCCAP
mmetsp:Transcript_77867/g.196605  ORF Transcript_77867/g.196605 Transcript_77867/m.196605 type:complete len:207 (+) Transcript_77867:5724-6344(+)